jgi:hypothetical protein
MSDPALTWNHRVIEFVDLDGKPWRSIHEVHYADGRPVAYTEGPAHVTWDTDEGDEAARLTLQRMLACLDRPVLIERDFEAPSGGSSEQG